jgi:hypothetical protein
MYLQKEISQETLEKGWIREYPRLKISKNIR